MNITDIKGREEGQHPEWYETLLDYFDAGRINGVISLVNRKRMSARDNPLLSQLLDSNKWNILRYLERSIGRDFDGMANTAEILDMIRAMGVDWPELDTFWDDNKKTVMTLLLKQLASKDQDASLYGWQELHALLGAGVRWPELEQVKRAVDADLASDRDDLEEGGVMLSNLMSKKLQNAAEKGFADLQANGSRWLTRLRDDLHRAGASDSQVKDIFNMNKGMLLHAIEADMANPRTIHSALVGIHQCRAATGMLWPEFKRIVADGMQHIKRWVDWYLSHYASQGIPDTLELIRDIGIEPSALRELKKHAMDSMLKEIKAHIKQRGFDRIALNGLEALEKMGAKVNMQDPRTQARMAADLESKVSAVGLSNESLDVMALMMRYGGDTARNSIIRVIGAHKVPIVRGMLMNIKKDYMYTVLPAYTVLRNLGIDWHELDIIGDTLRRDIGDAALAEARGTGPRMMADSTAKRIKHFIDIGDDISVGYAVQELNKIDADIAAEALSPIAGDLAKWFSRIAIERNSPGFALRELYRLWTYIEVVYPEVGRALDDAREPIVRLMLELIRDRHEEEAARYADMLAKLSVGWRELKVIRSSLLESAWEYGEAWRARLEAEEYIRDLEHDLQRGNWEMLALSLLELGHLDIELTVPNRIRQMIEGGRRAVVKSILNDIAENPDSTRMLKAVLALNNLGFNWDELAVIHDSLSAPDKPKNIAEDLGNLANLGVGGMIDVLKQPSYSSRKYGSNIGSVGKRFHSQSIGSTSEIRDVGVLKNGMKGLRKAFRDNPGAEAFALYIGGKPAMFGVTDSEQLAGPSRESKIAYDLTPYSDMIERLYPESWRIRKPAPTSAGEEPASRFDGPGTKSRKFAGRMQETSYLSNMLDLIDAIGKETKQPVTIKLVMSDSAAAEKRISRGRIQQELKNLVAPLKDRLAVYKNAKRPTADTIEDFVRMSLTKQVPSVRFANGTYSLKSGGYDTIKVSDLMSGKPFKAQYASVDPNSYDSVNVTYAFNPTSNQLLPIKAAWTDRGQDGKARSSVEVVVDPVGYLSSVIGPGYRDKNKTIPAVLKMIKAGDTGRAEEVISAIEKSGMAWPEIDAIRRGIKAG